MALRRRVLVLPLLALAAFHGFQPAGAFDFASSGTRAVAANVVSDATSYLALSGGSCTVPLLGGSCSFTITNLGTAPQTYTITRQTEGAIGTYAPEGATPVASGPVSTPGEIAVGASTVVTANVNACAECSGTTATFHWKIEGAKTGVLHSERTRFTMTITYT